jgi:hypothetical protein
MLGEFDDGLGRGRVPDGVEVLVQIDPPLM